MVQSFFIQARPFERKHGHRYATRVLGGEKNTLQFVVQSKQARLMSEIECSSESTTRVYCCMQWSSFQVHITTSATIPLDTHAVKVGGDGGRGGEVFQYTRTHAKRSSVGRPSVGRLARPSVGRLSRPWEQGYQPLPNYVYMRTGRSPISVGRGSG